MGVALIVALGGCASWRQQAVPADVARGLLPFLEPGKTRRQEIVAKWGHPSFESRQDRVTAYRLAQDGFGVLAVVDREGRLGWNLAQYNLVLAFDANSVLEEYSLIQMREKSSW